MDLDPELDVTLSDGRQSASFRITPVAAALEAWAILEPQAAVTVVVGRAVALAARCRLDAAIAQRLAAGWMPVDAGPMAAALVPPTPLSPDLALQIGSLLEALDRARPALRAADPSGQLWAAYHLFLRQARRFGVGAPGARVARARTKRRLAELAEQAGDLPAALLHYRAALASHAGVGVQRRLALLTRHWPTAATARTAAAPVPSGPDRTGRRSGGRSPAEARRKPAATQKARAQIVAQIDAEVAARLRAACERLGQSQRVFIERAIRDVLWTRRHKAERRRPAP